MSSREAVVALQRKQLGISQRELADELQRIGLDVDKNAIQRIESGLRFVTDIELCYLSIALHIPVEDLIAERSRLP